MHHALLTALLLTSPPAPADAGGLPPAGARPLEDYALELLPAAGASEPRDIQLEEAFTLLELSRFLRSLPGESPIDPEQLEAIDDRADELLSGLLASELAGWHRRVEGARCEDTAEAPELSEAALAVEQAEHLLERGEVRYVPELIALLDFMRPPVEALSRLCLRS